MVVKPHANATVTCQLLTFRELEMAEKEQRRRGSPEGTPKRKKLRLSSVPPQANVPQAMVAQMMTFRLVGSPKRKRFEPRRRRREAMGAINVPSLVIPEIRGTGKVVCIQLLLICRAYS